MIDIAVLVSPLRDGGARLATVDAAALAAAQATAGRVTAISIGGRDAERALRAAIAGGAAEAVRVDASPADAWAVAVEAAAVLAEYPLVASGAAGVVGQTSLVPAFLAELLDRPLLAWVVAFDVTNDHVLAQRLLPRGERARMEVDLPAVVSVSVWDELAPTGLRARMAAARTEIGVRAGAGTLPRATVSCPHPPKPRRLRTAQPEFASGADRLRLLMGAATATTSPARRAPIEGSSAEAAAVIADFLEARQLLP